LTKIDKNIPAPAVPNTLSPRYPFIQMDVGDSFFVAAADLSRVKSAAYYFTQRRPEYRFTVQKYNGAYRCWRVEVPSLVGKDGNHAD
jgi:hypothetical protein